MEARRLTGTISWFFIPISTYEVLSRVVEEQCEHKHAKSKIVYRNRLTISILMNDSEIENSDDTITSLLLG